MAFRSSDSQIPGFPDSPDGHCPFALLSYLSTPGKTCIDIDPLWFRIPPLTQGVNEGASRLYGTFRRTISLTIALILLASLHGFAATSTTSYRKKLRRGRHIHWAPLLRGSRESLVRQNEEIDRLQLPRIENDEELDELVASDALAPIVESDSLRIHHQLEPKNRFCKPWTLQFVQDMADAYYREFRQPIQVNSAVRTMQQQKKLRRRNRNAAPIDGDTASSHLAGITVDISKRGMSRKQRKWVSQYMLELQNLGLLEAAEERRQPVFHIMVSERYSAWREASRVASESAASGSAH